MLITETQYNELQPHDEVLERTLNLGYIKQLTNEETELFTKVYSECYPEEVIQRNCSACLFKIIHKLALNFLTYKKTLIKKIKLPIKRNRKSKDVKSTD